MKKFIQRIKRLPLIIKHKFLYWKYEKFFPWFEAHKNHVFFTTLEKSNWFPWYGKRVVYVKTKDVSKLTPTEKGVKEAIKAKDYKRALDIVNELPCTTKTVMLKQIIESKIK